jgi:hypothetical protein
VRREDGDIRGAEPVLFGRLRKEKTTRFILHEIDEIQQTAQKTGLDSNLIKGGVRGCTLSLFLASRWIGLFPKEKVIHLSRPCELTHWVNSLRPCCIIAAIKKTSVCPGFTNSRAWDNLVRHLFIMVQPRSSVSYGEHVHQDWWFDVKPNAHLLFWKQMLLLPRKLIHVGRSPSVSGRAWEAISPPFKIYTRCIYFLKDSILCFV